MRDYFLEDPYHPNGGITIGVLNDHDCVFCDHCTDVFWDYDSLVYAISCNLDYERTGDWCPHFTESVKRSSNGVNDEQN